MSKQKTFQLTNGELKALVFWASVGVSEADGGQCGNITINLIVKFSKLLNLKQGDFPPIGYKARLLGKELVERLNIENGLRFKLTSPQEDK